MAGATGLDQVAERTTEEAIVRALESPAVERAIFRVLESDEAQEALERTLSSQAVERAAIQVLDSQLVDRVWERLLASDEVQKLVERIAEAPGDRAAIASQGVGLIGDIGRQIRQIAGRFDDALERIVRRIIGRPRTEPTRNVGLVTRASPFLLDAAILDGIFLRHGGRALGARSEARRLDRPGFVLGVGAWIIAGSALPADLLVARRPDAGDAIPVDQDRRGRLAAPRLQPGPAQARRAGAGADPVRARLARRRSPATIAAASTTGAPAPT